jgi:two-component system CheB/CheR fusion protein
MGRPISDITSKIMYENLYKDAKDVLDKLNTKEVEIQMIDGQWYNMRILPYRTVENVIDGAVITFVDITKKKQAEEETIRASGFAKTVLNSIHDAISIVDVKDYEIIDCNEALLKELGMKRENVIGKTCHEIFHNLTERDQCITQDYLCPIEDTLKMGKYSVAEHVHCRKDGKKIHVEVSASPIKNEKGEVVQVVYVARDITERRQKEE